MNQSMGKKLNNGLMGHRNEHESKSKRFRRLHDGAHVWGLRAPHDATRLMATDERQILHLLQARGRKTRSYWIPRL